jgi:proton glutamate symport protein
MKIFKLKLYHQILLGLILGAVFGGIFHINKNEIEIVYLANDQQVSELVKFDIVEFIIDGKKEILKDQNKIIQMFNQLSQSEKQKLLLVTREKSFSNILEIKKAGTIATQIKPIGTIFINLLNMIAIPLVLASLIVGVASLGNVKKLARIGGKTIAIYILTTIIAISIGLILGNLIQPGKRLNPQTREELVSAYQTEVEQKVQTKIEFNLIDQVVNLVPRNIFKAMADAQMLQIVFFALMVGLALTLLSQSKSEPVIKFFDGFSDAMIKLVDLIMLIAPYGVFALISATVAEFGFEIIGTLFWYIFTVLAGLLIHTIFVYSGLVKFFGKLSPKIFFKGMRRAQIVAFTTSSSAATLPVNMECCEENLGISKSITSFTLPLGATINMDGTALYQGVAAIFISQVFGMDLSIGDQLVIIFTAVLASIGTAPVPGVGIIMLLIILKAVHIPEIGIALILGVDRILDMCRTVTNITGDAAVSVVVARSENQIRKIDLSEA